LSAYTWLSEAFESQFADPFGFFHEGETYVFCEQMRDHDPKGVISFFTLRPDGRNSQPRIVLERPYHLSYPFIFERGGEIFMIPETGGNRTLELYRAERFPDHWVLESILLEGEVYADATLIEYEGRLWLFATTTRPGGSTWDALCLYYADEITGPWTQHPLNPVLVDAGSARPAGRMDIRDGMILRVAQDCREIYGGGLSLCAVERLDTQGFRQRVLNYAHPAAESAAIGMHTLNRVGPFELMDAYVLLGKGRKM
jgi:hypothetical protein